MREDGAAHPGYADRRIEELIRLYSRRMLSIASSFESGATAAEDLVQNVWLLVLERPGQVPTGTLVGPWLYRVTINMGREAYRKRVRRQGLLRKWGGRSGGPNGDGGDPAPGVRGHGTSVELWEAIHALPELQRDCVLLKVVEEATYSQIAEQLGRAEGTIKASVHRGLARLRRRLEPEEMP
jgi:RNA polymerase sigma-70 factor (ECF subfamily)